MNTTGEFIISQLNTPLSAGDIYHLEWLIDGMNYEEVCELHDELTSNIEADYSDHGFEAAWEAVMDICNYVEERKRALSGGYRSISEVLAEFKKHPHTALASEMLKRFDHLTRREQKRIIAALLNAEDEDEMYMTFAPLNDELAQEMLPQLERTWLKHSYMAATIYFIKYSSEEFLLKHLDKIEEFTINYNKLCVRLKDNPKFEMKEERLYNKWQYFATLCAMGRKVTRQELMMELFATIKSALLKPSFTFDDIRSARLHFFEPEDAITTVKSIPEIKEAIHALHEVELNEELRYFLKWESEVKRAYVKELDKDEYSYLDSADEIDRWMFYCRIAKEHFPDPTAFSDGADQAKRAKSEEMGEQMRSQMGDVFEILGLELIDEPFEKFPLPQLTYPYKRPHRRRGRTTL